MSTLPCLSLNEVAIRLRNVHNVGISRSFIDSSTISRYLFHGTDKDFLDSFLNDGFELDHVLDGIETQVIRSRGFYLTSKFNVALKYAKTHAKPCVLVVMVPPNTNYKMDGEHTFIITEDHDVARLGLAATIDLSHSQIQTIYKPEPSTSRPVHRHRDSQSPACDPPAHHDACYIETAKSSRSTCRSKNCGGQILKGEARFKYSCKDGNLPNGMYGVKIPAFYHTKCIFDESGAFRANLRPIGRTNLIQLLTDMTALGLGKEFKDALEKLND